jgi:hypothetical protein
LKKYILDFEYESGFNAGSKARDDVEFFLNKSGFKLITLKRSTSVLHKILKPITLINELNKIENEGVVLIQHPSYVQNWYIQMIIRILKKKKVKMLCLIHDLNSLRHADHDVTEELNMLRNFDVVISHNENMTVWLKSKGLDTPIINLEVFDYHSENFQVELKDFDKNSIAVAGNLIKEKSGYIYQFNKQNLEGIKVNLYGIGYESGESIENIKYFGALPPNELPLKIEGGYGLIWDGPVLRNCEGEYGEYTKYNNPHKLSLYLASGLPVIVWKEAAIAAFVNKNNIGIAVDSIEEINSIVLNTNSEQYEQMQRNVRKVREKVIDGFYINEAVNTGLKQL